MIMMIDNYDSFTYNLVHYCRELGANISVFRNDELKLNDIKRLSPKKIILSPGPKTPNEAGICLDVIAHFYQHIPILGVCLGHQCIAQSFGAKICQTRKIRHGKTVLVYHKKQGIFKTNATPFSATLYNSLVVAMENFPETLNVTAWTQNQDEMDEIMGLQHPTYPLFGVQFHPEAILTEQGHDLLQCFLEV